MQASPGELSVGCGGLSPALASERGLPVPPLQESAWAPVRGRGARKADLPAVPERASACCDPCEHDTSTAHSRGQLSPSASSARGTQASCEWRGPTDRPLTSLSSRSQSRAAEKRNIGGAGLASDERCVQISSRAPMASRMAGGLGEARAGDVPAHDALSAVRAELDQRLHTAGHAAEVVSYRQQGWAALSPALPRSSDVRAQWWRA